MKVYSQLDVAQFENWSSDPAAGVVGRFGWNTTIGQIKSDDGTNYRAILRNDGKAIIGNSVTASQNIRFHRGAIDVLQLVPGDDVTAEGTLATTVQQLSASHENYTLATRPAFGNIGRVIYVTDIPGLQVDTGAAWVTLSSSTASGRLAAIYNFVVGSAAQVISGDASHSTWASAITAAAAGQTIKVLPGTWVENVVVSKQLFIEGSGYGTVLTGSIEFQAAASRSSLSQVGASDNITLDSGANLIKVETVWLASGKTFIDNGTANLLEAFQET